MRSQSLYFAYGSNLSLAQMRDRCPAAQPVAPFILREHRLAFVGERTQRWGRGGVATVLPQAGAKVYGALYRLSTVEEELLDGFEGVASGSYRKDYTLIDVSGAPALVYIADGMAGAENEPNEKYVAVIRQGFLDWRLPVETLAGLESYPADSA